MTMDAPRYLVGHLLQGSKKYSKKIGSSERL